MPAGFESGKIILPRNLTGVAYISFDGCWLHPFSFSSRLRLSDGNTEMGLIVFLPMAVVDPWLLEHAATR